MPLKQMGLEVEGDRDRLPLIARGSASLVPIVYELPVPSAQVKSAVLLAGLHAAGETTVIEREATRDHTERMLRHFGAEVRVARSDGKTRITVTGEAELQGRDVAVPADPTSAAFLIAAALHRAGLGRHGRRRADQPDAHRASTQTLQEMGADIAFLNEREEGGEPVADIRARHRQLAGVARRRPHRAPSHDRRISDARRRRRVRRGRDAHGRPRRAEGEGKRPAGGNRRRARPPMASSPRPKAIRSRCSARARCAGGGTVATHLDHRIAMAFLTMGLASREPVTVDDTAMIATSFPEFVSLMESLGARFRRRGEGDATMIIAIDGPAASGKGTLAKRLADHLGSAIASTPGCSIAPSPATSRAAAFRLDDCLGGRWRRPAASIRASLGDPDLRTPQAGDAASIVARIPQVRAALLVYQRSFRPPPAGRGARRPRYRHRRLPGRQRQDFRHRPHRGARQAPFSRVPGRGAEPSPIEAVLADIMRRDARDAGRGSAPMVLAADADLLDTCNLGIEAAFDAAVGLIKRKIGQ